MPKLPRISGRECVKILEKLGFVQVRQKGSHVIMRREDRGCVVPLHRELKVGTLQDCSGKLASNLRTSFVSIRAELDVFA